jgi:uroporphyrin-III C-methyltransferase
VRTQLAADLQALRNTRLPDRTGVLTRLANAETQSAQVPVRGLLAVERPASRDAALPEGVFARARAMTANAFASLVRVRQVDERSGSIVTQDEELVRRQHLQLLLFTARSAVARHDQAAYRSALTSAHHWLNDYFDMDDPATQALRNEIKLLEGIEIDPRLPNISQSAESLQRLMPRSSP